MLAISAEIGMALSFLASALMFPQGETESSATIFTKYQIMTYAQSGIAGILLLSSILYLPDRPKRPPNQLALDSLQRRFNLWSSMKSLVADKRFWLATIPNMIVLESFMLYYTSMNLLFAAIGVSQLASAWIGFVSSLLDLLFGIVLSHVAAKYQKAKTIMIVSSVAAIAVMLWQFLFVQRWIAGGIASAAISALLIGMTTASPLGKS